MKKNLLLLFFLFLFQFIQAQVIKDTVSVGPNYVNQVWYSLQNDNQATAPLANWDIAFGRLGFGASIYINSVTGTTLWRYAAKDTSGWATLDTAGIKNWPMQWNSDTSWVKGAFDGYSLNPANQFDLGWGLYNMSTHIVTGHTLYVIKLSTNVYKKLWIQSLSSGLYTFRFANLDGSDDYTAQLNKTSFNEKNFGYYSLQTKTFIDREPKAKTWDLLFTSYTSFVPDPYSVTGILQNATVRVADVRKVNDPATYVSWSNHPLKTAINEIGHDWKTYGLLNSAYTIEDSLVYFVKSGADIWKVIPTGFGGKADGNIIFSKEKLKVTGIQDMKGYTLASLSVYPNPSSDGTTTIVYNLENDVQAAILRIIDLSGRVVQTQTLNNNTGLYTFTLPVSELNAGIYIVNLETDGHHTQQKLIISN